MHQKTKHAAGPALCTQPLHSLPFLFIRSLSKVRLYIRLCGVWYRSEVVGLPRTVALSIIARHISSGKGSALVALDTGAQRQHQDGFANHRRLVCRVRCVIAIERVVICEVSEVEHVMPTR